MFQHSRFSNHQSSHTFQISMAGAPHLLESSVGRGQMVLLLGLVRRVAALVVRMKRSVVQLPPLWAAVVDVVLEVELIQRRFALLSRRCGRWLGVVRQDKKPVNRDKSVAAAVHNQYDILAVAEAPRVDLNSPFAVHS
jgi:hypothetical protein